MVLFGQIKAFLEENRAYFAAFQGSIADRNRKMLRKGSVIYGMVLCFYTILTIATHQSQLLKTMYYVFDAIHLCLCAAIFGGGRQTKLSGRATRCHCACLEASILGFFALEGVFTDRTQPSLYIPIAILLVLLLFIHRVVYAYSITGAYLLTFAVLSYLYKTPEAFIQDLYIAIATLISAGIGYLLIAQMRHSEGIALAKYEKLSQTDQLTGLSNKASIMKACEGILADPSRSCLFLFIDLDDFKRINDCYGHDVGDEVIRAVGEELKAGFQETDKIGRFGGDEFIVLMDNCRDIASAENRVEVLLKRIRTLHFSRENLCVSCSVGITANRENDTAHTILERADAALYQAKKSEKGHYKVLV